jgi:hypothetical protein
MRSALPLPTALVAILLWGAISACERRTAPLVGDAATTGAPFVTGETAEPSTPVVESAPLRPEPTEEARDAGVTVAKKPPDGGATLPRWVPKDASLTIIGSLDRDRNLGIAPAAPAASPSRVTVDAGGVAVEIEIRAGH